MLDKYFNKKFKTLRGVKIAIFFKRIYDWFRLTRNGEKILSQSYGIGGNWNHNVRVGKTEDYYSIINLVMTANMMYDINEHFRRDYVAEIEESLANEIQEDIDGR